MSKYPLLIVLAICLTASVSVAQFPGDAFFEPSSVLIPEGQSASVDLLFFSGTEAFGSAILDFEFDPSKVDVRVEPSPLGMAAVPSELRAPGRVSVAVLNESSLDAPFGTIVALRLVVKPRVPGGSSTVVTVRTREALQADGDALSPTSAFGLAVFVGESALGMSSADSAGCDPAPPSPGSTGGDAPLGPEAAVIQSWVPVQCDDGVVRFRPVEHQSIDTTVIGDR